MEISVDQSRLTPMGKSVVKPPRATEETLAEKKLSLRKATKEFESFFILQMLRDMRKTIPKSELIDGGLGQDIYTSMFDEQLARNMAGTSANSLADILYRSLEKHLEATAAAEAGNVKGHEVSGSIDGLRGAGKTADAVSAPRREEPLSTPQIKPSSKADVSSVPEKQTTVPQVEIPHSARPRVSTDPVLSKYGTSIDAAAKAFRVNPRLIYSVIMTESSGRAEAVSPKGAKGLMQLLDSTASDLGVADSLNPHQNIMGGTKYLRHLLDRYDGNIRLALAAYNSGPSTVSKYNGVPPYPETRDYITEVLGRLHSDKKL